MAKNANKTPDGANAKKKKRRIGFIIAEIACVIVIIVCAVLIFQQVNQYQEADNDFEEITEQYERDIDLLESDNPNCIGWVSVSDTRIDYPVMYTPNDPEYYLHRNFEGQYSAAGTPFLGENCLVDGNSSIVYGHNMNDGSMFASLNKFANPDFGLEHTIEYKTIVNSGTYKLLGCWYEDLTTSSRYPFWEQVGNLDEQRFNDYVANIKRLSLYDSGMTASYGDELLALVTCSYGSSDERFIVVAVKTDTLYKDDGEQ